MTSPSNGSGRMPSVSFLFLLVLSHCAVIPNAASDYYVAAVAEHDPIFAEVPFDPKDTANLSSALRIMMLNVDKYEQYMTQANASGAQIIVVPEGGMLGGEESLAYMQNLPTRDEISQRNFVPCDDIDTFANEPVLRRLSCLARRFSMALVVNLGDVQPCQPLVDDRCPRTGLSFYNTDVVFDTDGKLLAKYHKRHLYIREQLFVPAETVDYAIFETSFGVKFGVFTCFDIFFEKPAHLLVTKYGVRNIAFPTAWVNEFPYLVSTEVQQAYSRSMGVNLLAANLHIPRWAGTGSGIYSKGRVLAEFMNFQNKTKVLIARVPVNPDNNASLMSHYDDDEYYDEYEDGISGNHPAFIYKPFYGNEGNVDVCYENLCCHLKFSRSARDDELYALGAFSGFNTSEAEKYKMQACTLLKCAGTHPSSCGQQVFNATTPFESLIVSGTFSESTFIYPMFMTGNRHLVNPQNLHLEKGSMAYIGDSVPVLTATLYGRIFTE